VKIKMADTSLVSRLKTTAGIIGITIAKNIAKTAGRQLGGRHLLFGEGTNLNIHYQR